MLVNQISKTSRKLKREVNRRRKLKAGLKLKQKGGEKMYILYDLYEGVEEVGQYEVYEEMLEAVKQRTLDTDGECEMAYVEK